MIDWKKVQQKLGVVADGVAGPGTIGALLNACVGKVPVEVSRSMAGILGKADLTTPNRLASFIAQTAHESGNYSVFTENLNYGAKGLRGTWPSRFPTDAIAKKYERNPQMIAEKVYGGRMGNGPEGSGDGWKYRGAGYIQLTGKDNFELFAKWMGLSLDEAAVYARTRDGAMQSAVYYWSHNNINKWADNDNIIGQRRAINGGLIGVAEVVEHYKKALSFLV